MGNTIFKSEEQIKNIVNLYSSGKTLREIGGEYSVSKGVIRRILIKNNISRRINHLKEKFDPFEKIKICEMYEKGISGNEISKAFNCSPPTVYSILHKFGIKLGELLPKRQKHTCNDLALSILNEASEYWTGFLMADGNVDRKKNTLKCGLGIKDLSHLEKMKDFFGVDNKIEVGKRPIKGRGTLLHEFCSLRFSSVRIKEDLAKYGVVPKKSLKEKALNGIENSRHFWRGVVDGDGCLSFSKGLPNIALVGSKDLMVQFYDFIIKNIPDCKIKLNSRKTEKYKRIYMVCCYSSIDTKKITNLLYGNSTIYLDRKKKLYEEFMKYKLKREMKNE